MSSRFFSRVPLHAPITITQEDGNPAASDLATRLTVKGRVALRWRNVVGGGTGSGSNTTLIVDAFER